MHEILECYFLKKRKEPSCTMCAIKVGGLIGNVYICVRFIYYHSYIVFALKQHRVRAMIRFEGSIDSKHW